MDYAFLILVGALVGVLVCVSWLAYSKRYHPPKPTKRSHFPATPTASPAPVSPAPPPTDESAFLHPVDNKSAAVENYELWQKLTPREIDVAQHIASGLSNAEVADKLNLSKHTVDSYLKKAYFKLGVHSRSELINFIRDLSD